MLITMHAMCLDCTAQGWAVLSRKMSTAEFRQSHIFVSMHIDWDAHHFGEQTHQQRAPSACEDTCWQLPTRPTRWYVYDHWQLWLSTHTLVGTCTLPVGLGKTAGRVTAYDGACTACSAALPPRLQDLYLYLLQLNKQHAHVCREMHAKAHDKSPCMCAAAHRPAAGLHSATSAGCTQSYKRSAGGTKATLLVTVPTSNKQLSMRATAGMACMRDALSAPRHPC